MLHIFGHVGNWADKVGVGRWEVCAFVFCHFRYLSLYCWFIGAPFCVSQNENNSNNAKSTHKLEMAHFFNLAKRPIKRSEIASVDAISHD